MRRRNLIRSSTLVAVGALVATGCTTSPTVVVDDAAPFDTSTTTAVESVDDTATTSPPDDPSTTTPPDDPSSTTVTDDTDTGDTGTGTGARPGDGPGPAIAVAPADVLEVGPAKPSRSYDELAAAAIADVELWWADTYPAVYGEAFESLADGVYPAYPGRDDLPGCGEPGTDYRDVELFVAFYCSLGDFIIYDDGDESLLGALVEEFGPAVMGVVLAHEYGHAIQQRSGALQRRLPTIATEQQADCFAGAWVARAASGESPFVRFDDHDVLGGLIAMVTVRDPVGVDQLAPGGHGSAFDRVGAFQEGFARGAARCAELLDDPLPLMPNEFRSEQDFLNDGDLPFGFGESDIVPLVVDTLNSYWTFQLDTAGVEFGGLTAVPVDDLSEVDCPGGLARTLVGVAACLSTFEVYFDLQVAQQLYDGIIDSAADFAIGYYLGLGWAEATQQLLGSELRGEPRALANDCLVGAWSLDLFPRPESELRPDELAAGGQFGVISPGDLDEAVIAIITLGDRSTDEDVLGSPSAKIAAYRSGVIEGIAGCAELLGG